MNYEEVKLADKFKALSDTNRVNVIKLLTEGEKCVCKLLDELNITQSTLYHHMKVLTECKLVNGKKDGRWTNYSINKEKQ